MGITLILFAAALPFVAAAALLLLVVFTATLVTAVAVLYYLTWHLADRCVPGTVRRRGLVVHGLAALVAAGYAYWGHAALVKWLLVTHGGIRPAN